LFLALSSYLIDFTSLSCIGFVLTSIPILKSPVSSVLSHVIGDVGGAPTSAGGLVRDAALQVIDRDTAVVSSFQSPVPISQNSELRFLDLDPVQSPVANQQSAMLAAFEPPNSLRLPQRYITCQVLF